MGKCIKCGNETQNSYTYYAGDVLNINTDKFGTTTTTKITYTNIQKQSEYLCTKHSEGIGFYNFYLVVVFCIAIFTLILVIISSGGNPWPGVISFSLLAILFFLLFIRGKRKHEEKIKLDTRSDETNAAINLVNYLKEKNKSNPKKAFFTTYEYINLR